MQTKKNISVYLLLFLGVAVGKAQVVGGRSNSQSSPKEVTASELTKGAYNADVNLFTGGLSASYTLGSVSTPSGLSFTLTMGNSSSFSGGDNAPLSKGIPYGEGWSLNLPSISVSTESYTKYNRVTTESNNQFFNDAFYSEFDGASAGLEGTTFWFSPTINIPGVISERFIYKYTETEGGQKGALVFVPAYFETYAEARLKDNTWTVTTADGTVYVFGGGTASIRNASNQRYIVENVLDPQSSLYIPGAPAESVFIPKLETSLNWTVSEIYHPNYPNNQRILFGYERYGAFDYYKEFQQEQLQNALNHVRFNFTVHKDVLLKQVYSVENFGTTYIEKIELNYKTNFIAGTYNMLLPEQEGVSRLDSLYNYKTVYAQGINNSAERTAIKTTLTGDSEPFTNWVRYHHIRSNEAQDFIGLPTLISSNPYVYTTSGGGALDGGVDTDPANLGQKLVRSPALVGANGNQIPFNHSFLESPIINTGIDNLPLPAGDVYEIKTYIGETGISKFCNFDINIVAGDGGSEDVAGNSMQTVEYNWYQRHRNTNVFTTFNQAVKWNIGECLGGNKDVVTSNLFSLANLPADFGGFRIQVGPGNSDHDFSLYGSGSNDANRIADVNFYQTANGTIPNAYLAYHNFMNDNASGNVKYGQGCSPASSNFGIGLEWHMMRKTYSDMYYRNCAVSYNLDDPRYKSWWNLPGPLQAYNNHWDNVPTHADENVDLLALELVRYSKNPYLLTYVKTYRINGIDELKGKEKEVLTSMLKFDYDVVVEDIKNNVDHTPPFAQSPQQNNPNQKQNIFQLKRIHEIPVNSANANAVVAGVDTTKVPTTHFKYTPYQNVDPSNIFAFLGLSTAPTYALTQIVDRLGGITNYEYYDFDADHFLLNSYYNWRSLNPTHKGIWPDDIQMGKSFAISYTLSVKKKTVVDASTSTYPKEWNYSYQSSSARVLSPQNLGYNFDVLSTQNEPGYLKTIVTEPLVDANPSRVRAEYTHYITEENGILFGKLKLRASYDAGNHLIEKKEYEYKVEQAYTNGVCRSPEQMPSTFDAQKLKHHTFANGDYFEHLGGQVPVFYLGARPANPNFTLPTSLSGTELSGMRFLEQGNPHLFAGGYLSSFFTPMIKETNTEYDIQLTNTTGPIGILSTAVAVVQTNSVSNLVSVISNNGNNVAYGSAGVRAGPSTSIGIDPSPNWPAVGLKQTIVSNITEYEYWDADITGKTTCAGNKILEGQTSNNPIQLVFEPSWQLYKKKMYSPQLPDAYSIEENFYFHDLKTWANIEGGGLGDTITNFDALNLCSAYLIRNLPYEMRTTTKSQGVNPVVKSNYYWYDSRFKGDVEHFYETDATINFTGPTCPTIDPGGDPDPNPPPAADCIPPRLNPNYPPPGYKLTITGPGYAWWCPYTPDDIPQSSGGSNEAQIFYSPTLYNFLFLRNTTVQVDVIPKNNPGYFNPGNTNITRFGAFLEGSVTTPYKPIYPYEVLVNYEVEARNHYGQVKLEHDAKGLKTRYYYHDRKRVYFKDDANMCNSLLFFPWFENMGLPAKITTGYGLADSLETFYTYNKDHSVLTVTDPNEMVMGYTYDEYGRLKNTLRNNQVLKSNNYHYWENDDAQTFEQRATENYVETFTLNNLNSTAGEHTRAYIDPQGRKYDVLTQASSDYTTPTVYDSKMVHSGLTIYDNWNRSIKQFKPFETGDGVNPEPFVPQFNNTNFDPNTQQQFENNQRSRALRAAKFGENIATGHTVNSSYKLINGNILRLELNLTTTETQLLMPNSPSGAGGYTFLKTAGIDEDGKKIITYTDAMGRQVATKTYITYNNTAVTLFVYNSQGQQALVINPLKQQSTYHYNLLGQLYSKTTVDAGTVYYMYNKSGQVVLEQDANGVAGTDNGATPYLRKYTYDDFGRMIKQERVIVNGINPLQYQSYNLPDQYGIYSIPPTDQVDAYSVNFSDALTTDYAFKVKRLYINQQNNETSEDVFDPYSLTAALATEKQLAYHFPFNAAGSYLDNRIVTYLGTNAQAKLKGRLSYSTAYDNNNNPVHLCLYAYTNEGFVKNELNQFKSDGLASAGGIAQAITYDHNLRGNTTHTVVDDGLDNIGDFGLTNIFDERNRLYYATISQGASVNYTYDNALGLLKNKQNSVDYYAFENVNYTYDVRDRLTDINSSLYDEKLYYDSNLPQTGTTVYDVSATKNYNGNINAIKSTYKMSTVTNYGTMGNAMDGETHYGYTYDGMNRLTNADASVTNVLNNAVSTNPALKYGDEKYSYDKIGNISNLQRGLYYLPNAAAGNAVTAWDYNYTTGSNKLYMLDSNAFNLANYTYDANGNLRTDSKKKILGSGYGRGNLPIYLEVDKGTPVNDFLTYIYDVKDSRIYKENLGTANTNGEYYLHDASGRTIGIYDMTNATWTWYAFGLDRIAKVDASGSPEFYEYDHLGNIRVAYNASINTTNGIVLNTTVNNATDYYPGGKILRSYEGSLEKYRFNSKERDQETQLDYFEARYYDSDVPHFLQVDPMAHLRTAWSPYNAMSCNPINRTDPDGALDGEGDPAKKTETTTTANAPAPATTPTPVTPGNEVKLPDVQKLITTGKTVQDRVTNLANGIKEGDYITSSTLSTITNTPAPAKGEKPDVTAQRNLLGGIDRVTKTSDGFQITLKDGKESIAQPFQAIGGLNVTIKNNATVKLDLTNSSKVILSTSGVKAGWFGLPDATIKGDKGSVLGFSFPLVR